MILYKGDMKKEVSAQSVVERLIREGWSCDAAPKVETPKVEIECEPKKRGRPAKKEKING